MKDHIAGDSESDPTLLLTKTELAKHLRCSERQIDKLTADGRIPLPIMLGNCRRWPRSLIVEWIESFENTV